MNETQSPKGITIAFWIFTAIFALQMGFTAYAQLCMPQVEQVFVHLGFPNYFRIELCVAKLLGLVVVLVPMVPATLKEWAYTGFAIVLVSALIAHLAMGDPFKAWIWAAGTLVLEALSYYFYRRSNASRAR
jgi:hypothetical protein